VFFFNKLIISERSRLVFKFNRFTFKFQETKFQARRFESLLGVSILDGVIKQLARKHFRPFGIPLVSLVTDPRKVKCFEPGV